jgi:hypothetical protein
MDKAELKKQIEGAYDRITEALILLENIASKTAHSEAQDLTGMLVRADLKMRDYRGRLYQHQEI